MTLGLLAILLLGVFIAYVNGSNDVSKGVATLVGSGVTSYRRAILWGSLWTGIGGLAGAVMASALVATFGNGLLAGGVVPTLPAAIAGIAGAALFVALATRTGLPVSTTHAIVGSVAGVGCAAYGFAGVNWATLGGKVALPLLLSPLVSLAATTGTVRAWRRLSKSRGQPIDCLCAEIEPVPLLAGAHASGAALTLSSALDLRLTAAAQPTCADKHPAALRVTMNHMHWLTSGATSFARGMNDAPKMVALVLGAAALAGTALEIPVPAFLAVALGMVAGSWIAGRRVTTVLAEKVTCMDHHEGFIANLVTAALVAPGAALGLPMSTTHVSSGAIIGVGALKTSAVNWGTVRNLVLAWVVTLPSAAVLGIAAYATCVHILGVTTR